MCVKQIDSMRQGKQDSCESHDQQCVTVPGDWTDLMSTSFRVYFIFKLIKYLLRA